MIRIIVRRSLQFIWTSECTGVEKPKKWGLLRKTCVDLVMSQHPEVFGPSVLEALNMGSPSETVMLTPFEKFMNGFNDDDVARTDPSNDVEKGDSAAVDTKAEARLQQAKRFRRLLHDANMMLALSKHAADSKLHLDWGFQAGEAASRIMSTVVVTKELSPDTANPTRKIQLLCDIVHDVFSDTMNPDWFEFAGLTYELVYQPALMAGAATGSEDAGSTVKASLPQCVIDTCDATFCSCYGCERFLGLHVNITNNNGV